MPFPEWRGTETDMQIGVALPWSSYNIKQINNVYFLIPITAQL